MKNYIHSLITTLFLSFFLSSSFAQKLPENRVFYYAFNEKVYIDAVPGKYAVTIKNNARLPETMRLLAAEAGAKAAIFSQTDKLLTLDISGTQKTLAEVLKTAGSVIELVKPVYKYQQQEFLYSNEILVEPGANVSITDVINKNGLAGLVVVKPGDFFSTIVLPASMDACAVANKIQESGLVKYSHPNFTMPVERHQVIPNDAYFNNQFYLRNTGQVFNPVENHAGTANADINASFAWNVSTGNNAIIVAVIDEGVTPNHPDLPNVRQVRLNGSNFVPGENANDPTPGLNNNHGNSCSGVIAATQNNNEGVSGIAPNVRIMPIKVFGAAATASNNGFASAIDFAWQNGAHVISNSWGFGSNNPNLVPAIVQAITRAVTQGRGGRGSVVSFSAGNTAQHSGGNAGFVAFPSNVQINGVLTVGASDRNDLRSNYSPNSNAASPNNQIVDLVAPSHRAYPPDFGNNETFEVWTIDIPNGTGYNPWTNAAVNPPALNSTLPAAGVNFLSYTGRFGGTSASCPQVAAVAALILSLNNTLTQQQVFDIITQTADRVGGYTYTNGRSVELGNGRLNACAALHRIPGRYTINGLDRLCTTTTYTISGLPVGATVQWTSSNTNIATITNGGLATRINSATGSVVFTANITVPNRCGTHQVSKTVTVGAQVTISANITGCNGGGWQGWFLAANPISNGSNWNWTVGSGQVVIYSPTSPSTNISVNGGGVVRLSYTDACGTARNDGITVYSTCPLFRVAVSPNPVKNNMSVSLSAEETGKATESGQIPPVRSIESGGKTILSLFEMNTSRMVKQWVYNETSGKNYQLNIAGLRKGVYVLQTDRGNQTRVTKVIVE